MNSFASEAHKSKFDLTMEFSLETLVIDKYVPRRRAQSNVAENCYSLDDVRELLRKVLKEREVQLENDFGNFLCTSLDEQAEEFIKFNEAYIARQFRKNSEMSYVS